MIYVSIFKIIKIIPKLLNILTFSAPSFEDAMKMPKPENMPYISSSSGNIGWSIAAPANEKQ